MFQPHILRVTVVVVVVVDPSLVSPYFVALSISRHFCCIKCFPCRFGVFLLLFIQLQMAHDHSIFYCNCNITGMVPIIWFIQLIFLSVVQLQAQRFFEIPRYGYNIFYRQWIILCTYFIKTIIWGAWNKTLNFVKFLFLYYHFPVNEWWVSHLPVYVYMHV